MRTLILGVLSLLAVAPGEHVTAPLKPPAIESLGTPAPDFSYISLDGKMHHLRDLRGKAVFLDFWGTWCPGCVEEMPTIQQLYKDFQADPRVAFVIVAQNDTPAKVKAYAQKTGLTIPLSYVGSKAPSGVLATTAWPATYFISPDGVVRGVHRGGANWSDASVRKYLEDLKMQRDMNRERAQH